MTNDFVSVKKHNNDETKTLKTNTSFISRLSPKAIRFNLLKWDLWTSLLYIYGYHHFNAILECEKLKHKNKSE